MKISCRETLFLYEDHLYIEATFQRSIMKNSIRHQGHKQLFASIIILALAPIFASGCGGQNAAAPTAAPSNPQAADAAAKQSVAADAANAQARATSQAIGKAAVGQQSGQATH